jgi:hypothetical protein
MCAGLGPCCPVFRSGCLRRGLRSPIWWVSHVWGLYVLQLQVTQRRVLTLRSRLWHSGIKQFWCGLGVLFCCACIMVFRHLACGTACMSLSSACHPACISFLPRLRYPFRGEWLSWPIVCCACPCLLCIPVVYCTPHVIPPVVKPPSSSKPLNAAWSSTGPSWHALSCVINPLITAGGCSGN